MAEAESEPLLPAQPGLTPLGSEAVGRPSAPPRRRRVLRLAVAVGLLLCTAGVVLGWWVWNVFQVRTTNAYVVGNITPVSSDVGGQVVALYADDNMIVAAGAPLGSSIRSRFSSKSIGCWPICATHRQRCERQR